MASDIEVEIVAQSLSDHFLISPNALHRGEGAYLSLTLHERGMLSALLTMRPGAGRTWATSRTRIESIAPELGRDKVSAILRGLREKRYLYTKRHNVGRGRFRWEWRVYMTAQARGFDPFADTTDGSTTDGFSVDGKPVCGRDQRKPALPAGDGSSGPEKPSIKEEVPKREVLEKNPPPPARPATTNGAKPGGEGKAPSTDEETAIRNAIAHQPAWRPDAVRSAIRQAVDKGLPQGVAYRAIVDLAKGDIYGQTTAGPQRLIAHGPWWTPGEVFVPAEAKPKCNRHRGQPADNCSVCAGERLGMADPHQSTITPATQAPESVRAILASIPALRGRVTRP